MDNIKQIGDGCYVKGEYAVVMVETQSRDWMWAVIGVIGPKNEVEVLTLYNQLNDALEDLKQRN